MRESFLIKWQTGGLQPYLKRDFNTDFFPANVRNFLSKQSWTINYRQMLEIKQK